MKLMSTGKLECVLEVFAGEQQQYHELVARHHNQVNAIVTDHW